MQVSSIMMELISSYTFSYKDLPVRSCTIIANMIHQRWPQHNWAAKLTAHMLVVWVNICHVLLETQFQHLAPANITPNLSIFGMNQLVRFETFPLDSYSTNIALNLLCVYMNVSDMGSQAILFNYLPTTKTANFKPLSVSVLVFFRLFWMSHLVRWEIVIKHFLSA